MINMQVERQRQMSVADTGSLQTIVLTPNVRCFSSTQEIGKSVAVVTHHAALSTGIEEYGRRMAGRQVDVHADYSWLKGTKS